MTDITQLMRAANPVLDAAAALPDDELEALLLLTQTRSENMSVDQLEKQATKPTRIKSRYSGWMVAAAAFAIVLAVGLGVALLANNGGEDLPPATTIAPDPDPESRPATPVTAVLGADPTTETYFARSADDFDAAVMGIEPGTVTAEWFRAEGFYVVYFDGLDKTSAGGLCPSASIRGSGSDFMANAATQGADCSSIVINALPDPAVRTLECGNGLAYRTAIPDDTSGILVGSLEKPGPTSSGGSGIMGIESQADTATGQVPEVDLSIFEC